MVLGCQVHFLFTIIPFFNLLYFVSYAKIIFQLKKVICILRFIYIQGCNMVIIQGSTHLSKSLQKYPLYLEFITKAIIQNLLTKVSFCFILHYSSVIIRKKNLLHEISSAAWV